LSFLSRYSVCGYMNIGREREREREREVKGGEEATRSFPAKNLRAVCM